MSRNLKYLECVLDESGTDEAKCSKKVVSGKRVAGAIRSLVTARSLQFECARVLHESLLVPVLMYGSETMIRRKRERSRVSSLHMDSLRGLLDVKRMDSVLNTWIRQLCGESV